MNKTIILADDLKVPVQSFVDVACYTCPVTFESFNWMEAGEIHKMTYKQLRIMKARHQNYFTQGWIKPLNDDVIDKLMLNKCYENNLNRSDIKLLFGNNISAAENMLYKLNYEGKQDLINKVPKLVEDGKINNVNIIKMLEINLGIKLMNLV